MEQQVYTADNGAAPASFNDQHLACVLLLDTSGSMQNGNAIGALNQAMRSFKEQCMKDDYSAAFQKVNEQQQKKKLELWAVGVPGYDRGILTSITKRVIELDAGLDFAGLFDQAVPSLLFGQTDPLYRGFVNLFLPADVISGTSSPSLPEQVI